MQQPPDFRISIFQLPFSIFHLPISIFFDQRPGARLLKKCQDGGDFHNVIENKGSLIIRKLVLNLTKAHNLCLTIVRFA
jgi:hypothetical protein